MKGGAYYGNAKDVTLAARSYSTPSLWLFDFGFRVVVVPSLVHSPDCWTLTTDF